MFKPLHIEPLYSGHLSIADTFFENQCCPLLNGFTVLYINLFQSDVERVVSKPNPDLRMEAHDQVHRDFLPYTELMKWLKDLNQDKYMEIKAVSLILFLRIEQKKDGCFCLGLI